VQKEQRNDPRSQLGDGGSHFPHTTILSRSCQPFVGPAICVPFRRRASRGEAYQDYSLKTIPTAGFAAAGPVDREITLTLKTLISRRFRDKVIWSAETSRSGSS
jgi:hypothetical protein